MLENLLHLSGIPGHDDVGQEAQGNGLYLVGLSSLVSGALAEN